MRVSRGGENDEPLSDGRLYTSDNTETIVLPDTMRVTSWDELDNLTADALLGPGSGKVVKSHTYECVDTIAYSTLIFHVNALVGLPDTSESDTQVFKVAKWTVELVSVEYYPGLTFEPGHHNMMHSYFCHVDRYRNYSDGSRIGPDTYGDFGHFFGFSLLISTNIETASYGMEDAKTESIFPASIEEKFGDANIGRLPNGGIAGYVEIKEDGIHTYQGARYKLNRNAYFIWADGRKIDNEERWAINFATDMHFSSYPEPDIRNISRYRPSNSWPEWAITDEIAPGGYDLGQNVPILFRTDTVRTVRQIQTDWGIGFDVPVKVSEKNIRPLSPTALPKPWYGWFYLDFDASSTADLEAYAYPLQGRDIRVWDSRWFYCQFLYMDGRMFDFFDECNWHFSPMKASATRTSTGYYYHLEDEMMFYGIPHYRTADYYVDFYDGPEELIFDYSELWPGYGDDERSQEMELWNRLQEEKTSRSRAVSRSASPAPSVKLDTRLPHSFNRNK